MFASSRAERSSGRARASTTASRPSGLPEYSDMSMSRRSASRSPRPASSRPARSAARPNCSSWGSPRSSSVSSASISASVSGRLPQASHLRQAGAGGRQRPVQVRSQRRGVDVAEADQADLLRGQPVGHHRRREALGEPDFEVKLLPQPCVLRPHLVEVLAEALLEVLGRPRDDVAAERGADQDADRERDEHRCERGDVIASGVTHSKTQKHFDLQPDQVGQLAERV